MITAMDMFCGAGGTTTGVKLAGVNVVYAMNHNPLAIRSHNANHPDVLHDITDVHETNPRRYKRGINMLYASPECDYHTGAQGVRRDGQMGLYDSWDLDLTAIKSRATMDDVPRYAAYHEFQTVTVENVVEAYKWNMFQNWLQRMHILDYEHKIVWFNSQFAGVPQSRDRMYVVFWKKNHPKPNLVFTPPAFCPHCQQEVAAVQTWKNPNFEWGRYGKHGQYIYTCPNEKCRKEVKPYYRPASDAILWDTPIQRVADKSPAIVEKTLRRIEAGLNRYGNFLFDAIHTPRNDHLSSTAFPLDNPHRTMLSQITHGLVLSTAYDGDNRARPTDQPTPTLTSRQDLGLIMTHAYSGTDDAGRSRPTTEPMRTQTGTQDSALIIPPFLTALYGTSITQPLDQPLGTQTSSIHHGLVVPYYKTGVAKPTDRPIDTVTSVARHALLTTERRLSRPITRDDVMDCLYRMLIPKECKLAMGFDPDYVIEGNGRQQVEQTGQAVTPAVATMIGQRLLETFQ